MPINLEKIKQERAKQQFAGELMDFPEGETVCYVAALPYPDDEVPYAATKMHYGLGPKGKSQAMCLEPSLNEVMNNPHFNEQLKALDNKDLSGGCAVCENRDAGKKVSGDPEQDGKPSGRWLYIVMPVAYRANAQQQLAPWKTNEVKGFLVGYNVWDKICDQFGAVGDLTDLDNAVYIRVLREGKKLQTKWDIQIDVATARKGVKLAADVRHLLAEQVKPGGPCDPYRILASMARTRSNVEDLLKGIKTDDGAYEETGADAGKGGEENKAADTSAHKPPTQGKKPETKAAAAPPKDKPKTDTKKVGEDAELKKLIATHGSPPNCFKMDADPNDPQCQACPFKKPCADHLGVPVPPDIESDQTANGDDSMPSGIAVEEATVGSLYALAEGGDGLTYKGPAKGQHLFVGADGKPVKVAPGTTVWPGEAEAAAPEETSADDDAGLKALEAQLAAKKAKAAAAKK